MPFTWLGALVVVDRRDVDTLQRAQRVVRPHGGPMTPPPAPGPAPSSPPPAFPPPLGFAEPGVPPPPPDGLPPEW
ncbi:MAG: hypothetical protein IPM45_17275 [Acidimicrobiales bacterium]|nr:hypothetical protein [Acidimicrobiales bacterium]